MGQCLHNRNIQSLVVEMLEMKHGQSPEFVTDKAAVHFRTKSRLQGTSCEHSLSWFRKHLVFRPQNLGNRSRENKIHQFS